MKILLYFGILLGFLQPLSGEIEWMQIKWHSGQYCGTQCGQMLMQQFQKLNFVAQTYIDTNQGQVTLRWKPNFPFNYQAVQNALAMVGIGYDYMSIKARGYLQVKGNQFYLVSLGDNSPFALLGPAQTQQYQYTELENPASFPLTPYLQQQLALGIQQNRIAIVQGPLLLPEQGPPYYVVIEQLNFLINQQEAPSQ